MRKYDLGRLDIKRRNRLPHWHAEHAIYFITWCLADAIPAQVLMGFRAERDAECERVRRLRGTVTIPEKKIMDAALTAAIERFLDEHNGESLLRDHRAATIANSLRHFDGERYDLYAWCVMPNHVHAVFSCMAGFDASSILHSLKSFTSKEINKALGRSGTRWQAESYDRCVRDSDELQRTIDYVLGNPIAAGLQDWPFVGSNAARIDDAL
ncbi:MAG: transposase [Thermoanaerobaculia bacterium]